MLYKTCKSFEYTMFENRITPCEFPDAFSTSIAIIGSSIVSKSGVCNTVKAIRFIMLNMIAQIIKDLLPSSLLLSVFVIFLIIIPFNVNCCNNIIIILIYNYFNINVQNSIAAQSCNAVLLYK